MGDWIKIAKEKEITKNPFQINYKGQKILIIKMDDGIYAIKDECSHENASLLEGEILNGKIECPKHGARFDIRTGKNINLPAVKPIIVYSVKVEEGSVYLDFE